jgi:enoyl-CoA hydratase/carnithine racemase
MANESSQGQVLVTGTVGHVRVLRLNRPKKKNALDAGG